jgi:hypothetical protein
MKERAARSTLMYQLSHELPSFPVGHCASSLRQASLGTILSTIGRVTMRRHGHGTTFALRNAHTYTKTSGLFTDVDIRFSVLTLASDMRSPGTCSALLGRVRNSVCSGKAVASSRLHGRLGEPQFASGQSPLPGVRAPRLVAYRAHT